MCSSVPGMGFDLSSHLGDGHPGDPLLALDVDDGVAQLQGDAVVIQALDDVPLQAAGIGHQLRHALDLGALQGHAAGHNQADVAAAQNDHLSARQIAFQVDKALGGAGGEDSRGAGAPGMFSAPRGRSRQPMAKMTAPASTTCRPRSRLTQVTNRLSPWRCRSTTVVDSQWGICSCSAFSINRAAYSGPVSSSLKVCRPKPLWMHWLRMPPSSGSRSKMSTSDPPFSLAEMAAARPPRVRRR